MKEPVIQVEKLSKEFKNIKAVDGLSFAVNEGEVYGFLGQNGAGKSTTIRMLLTLITPTSGHIQILGKNLYSHRNEILSQVGAIIEKPDLYKYLTAYENVKMMAALSDVKVGRSEIIKQLELVGLSHRSDSKVKTFSQGMKQRLGIACALVHQPKLIILDEPTNGLDPQGIADVRHLILQLSREQKKTILVSSHLLSEIELIADSMLIIDKGKKLKEGKVNELLADLLVEVKTTDNEACLRKLETTSWQQYVQKTGEKIVLRLHQNQIPELNKDLVRMGIEVIALQPRHSLEAYFLSLTTPNQHVATYENRIV